MNFGWHTIHKKTLRISIVQYFWSVSIALHLNLLHVAPGVCFQSVWLPIYRLDGLSCDELHPSETAGCVAPTYSWSRHTFIVQTVFNMTLNWATSNKMASNQPCSFYLTIQNSAWEFKRIIISVRSKSSWCRSSCEFIQEKTVSAIDEREINQ